MLIFKTMTGNCFDKALFYLKALYSTEKTNRNIEKMTDGYSSKDYFKIQHFISESPWSARLAMDDAAKDVNLMFAGNSKVALVLDESSEEKKGTESVGVSHQYCGNLGKTCNSQVAVFAALVSDSMASIIDTRIYLPKSWTDDSARCKKAGIPKEDQVFKTKTELAFEIIEHQMKASIRFDWINADGLYGNDIALLDKINRLNLLYVIDIHSNKSIFLEEFEIVPKEKISNRGRNPFKDAPNKKSITANKFIESLPNSAWEKVFLRNGTKGKLRVETISKQVYIYDEKNQKCIPNILIVSRKRNSNNTYEYKYAFSNAILDQYTTAELAYMQCHRFWIENSFREAKQSLGMTDYQIRGWLAWNHHMALTFMAMAFALNEKINHKERYPLLTISDIRIILIHKFAETSVRKLPIMKQIEFRHEIRKRDIEIKNKDS
jgi:SRSO17 transposase